MIRKIYNAKLQDIATIRSNELLVRLGIEDPHSAGEKAPLKWTCGMLQWCSKDSLYNKVDRKRGNEKSKMTERDCREWKLSAFDPHDRHICRSGTRSAMHAASQLPGRGPTDVTVAPVAC